MYDNFACGSNVSRDQSNLFYIKILPCGARFSFDNFHSRFSENTRAFSLRSVSSSVFSFSSTERSEYFSLCSFKLDFSWALYFPFLCKWRRRPCAWSLGLRLRHRLFLPLGSHLVLLIKLETIREERPCIFCLEIFHHQSSS